MNVSILCPFLRAQAGSRQLELALVARLQYTKPNLSSHSSKHESKCRHINTKPAKTHLGLRFRVVTFCRISFSDDIHLYPTNQSPREFRSYKNVCILYVSHTRHTRHEPHRAPYNTQHANSAIAARIYTKCVRSLAIYIFRLILLLRSKKMHSDFGGACLGTKSEVYST